MTTPNGDTSHNDAACVDLFTETLSNLNAIHEAQMQAILDIAIAAADAANSISPSNTSSDFVERVTDLINEMKTESTSRDGDMGSGGRPAPEHDTATGGDTFCESVRAEINTALQNGLAAQQQLYVMGASVLAEGAQLILNAAKETPGEQ